MAKTSSISEFIGSFSNELARPCNFSVQLAIPESLIGKVGKGKLDSEVVKTLTLRCESAELPSRTFALVDQKTYGPIEQYPIQSAYNKSTMSFICSDDMSERTFFETWMEMISFSSPEYYRLNNTEGNDNSQNPIYKGVRFDFKYKDKYVVNAWINQHTLDGQISYRSVLVDAFPVELHSVPLRWAATNDYNRIVVTFAYRYAFGESDTLILNKS